MLPRYFLGSGIAGGPPNLVPLFFALCFAEEPFPRTAMPFLDLY